MSTAAAWLSPVGPMRMAALSRSSQCATSKVQSDRGPALLWILPQSPLSPVRTKALPHLPLPLLTETSSPTFLLAYPPLISHTSVLSVFQTCFYYFSQLKCKLRRTGVQVCLSLIHGLYGTWQPPRKYLWEQQNCLLRSPCLNAGLWDSRLHLLKFI